MATGGGLHTNYYTRRNLNIHFSRYSLEHSGELRVPSEAQGRTPGPHWSTAENTRYSLDHSGELKVLTRAQGITLGTLWSKVANFMYLLEHSGGLQVLTGAQRRTQG